jgi:predicted PurR-regulated permease PerM
MRMLAEQDEARRREERLVIWPSWLLALIAGLLGVWVLYRVRAILPPFILGGVVAYALDPVIDGLQARRVPRNRAIGLIFLLIVALVLLAAVVVIPTIADQAAGLADNYPRYTAAVNGYLNQAQEALASFGARFGLRSADLSALRQRLSLEHYGLQLLQAALGWLNASLSLVALLIITPVVAFWLLREYHGLGRLLLRPVPAAQRQTAVEVTTDINHLVGEYLLGVATMAGLVGLYSIIVLVIARVPFGVLLGALTGLLSIVPYVGFPTAMVIIGITMAVTGKTWVAILVVIALHIAANIGNDYVVAPRIYAGRIGLHPLAIIFAILAGGVLFGFVGVLLAVPIAGIIKLLLVRFWPEVFAAPAKATAPVAEAAGSATTGTAD